MMDMEKILVPAEKLQELCDLQKRLIENQERMIDGYVREEEMLLTSIRNLVDMVNKCRSELGKPPIRYDIPEPISKKP